MRTQGKGQGQGGGTGVNVSESSQSASWVFVSRCEPFVLPVARTNECVFARTSESLAVRKTSVTGERVESRRERERERVRERGGGLHLVAGSEGIAHDDRLLEGHARHHARRAARGDLENPRGAAGREAEGDFAPVDFQPRVVEPEPDLRAGLGAVSGRWGAYLIPRGALNATAETGTDGEIRSALG